MINNLNKNISVWRGDNTPPTDYHLWEKSDGTILTKIENKWKLLTSPKDKETLDESIKDIAIGEHTNEKLNLDLIDNNRNIKKQLEIPISSKEKSGLITAEDKLVLHDSIADINIGLHTDKELNLNLINNDNSIKSSLLVPISSKLKSGLITAEDKQTLYSSIKSGEINSNVNNPELVLKDNDNTTSSIPIPISSKSESGFMSTLDKIKLDNSIYDLGDFSLSSEAEAEAAKPEIGFDKNKTIIRYTIGENSKYIILQSISDMVTTLLLLLKGIFYMRYITYNSDNTINNIGPWTSCNPDSLGWNNTYHRYELFCKGKKLNGNMASIPEGTKNTLGLIDPYKFTIESTPSSEGLRLNIKYNGLDTQANTVIPNDTSIKDVQIATMDSTINSNGEIIVGTGDTALSIVYILSDKTYKLVNVSLSKFLEEKEFGDGLKVENHKVSIKTDDTSELYLTVSSNGIKISGLDSIFNDFNRYLDSLNDKIESEKINLDDHIHDTENPHNVTKSQVGLSEVTNDSQVKRSEMGVENGVATLDFDGKLLKSQIPEFLTNVFVYEGIENFPVEGELNKIYIDSETNLIYRWDGAYIEINKSLELGTKENTAYPGDKGEEVYNTLKSHVYNVNNPHNVTAELVGLGNVDNTSDSDKPISTETQEALDNKVDKVEGKGLSTLDFTNEYATLIEEADTNYKRKTVQSIENSDGVAFVGDGIVINKDFVGLPNVDNTSDLDKPISTATLTALNSKVDKSNGKSLVSDTEITKLSGLKTLSEINTDISNAKKAGTDALTAIDNHKANKDLQHIPTGGASNLILTWESSGHAKWETLEPCTTEEINNLFK